MGVVGAGCAAMQRTWSFHAATAGTPWVEPSVQSAKVTRNDVTLELTLLNKTSNPARLDVGRTALRLPDGTTIEGNADLVEQGQALAGALMRELGWMQPEGAIAPGQARELRLVFRHHRRDLRRFSWMTVDLSQVSLNGRPAGLPALVLTAPPDAPIGEDI